MTVIIVDVVGRQRKRYFGVTVVRKWMKDEFSFLVAVKHERQPRRGYWYPLTSCFFPRQHATVPFSHAYVDPGEGSRE